MRKFFTILVTTIVLVFALILIFNAPVKQYLVEQMSNREMNSLSKEQIAKNEKKSGEFDFSKVKPLTAAQVAKASVSGEVTTIGKLAVPSVGMKLPIVKGMGDAELSAGGGTMKEDQKMGKSNYALAGHYMTKDGALFSPLEKAQIGDLIYITDMKKVYAYKIDYKQKVAPTAVYLLNDTKGTPIITMITCADGGSNRWAVQGKLVSKEKATDKNLELFKK
ncbi:class A sortase [Lactobacillus terrae]|uniref:class A sortase n=1 Tax=Lactobacillus terrae TaxID=2269374 RepID=UPI000C1B60BB|nr:class A sortase [Lactobacillus terrae]